MLDLNDIVVFARVVEAGSFTAAARLLGMPKTTVSRRIAALEREIGVRLLQRTTRTSAAVPPAACSLARLYLHDAHIDFEYKKQSAKSLKNIIKLKQIKIVAPPSPKKGLVTFREGPFLTNLICDLSLGND